jgi:hypothetical protein
MLETIGAILGRNTYQQKILSSFQAAVQVSSSEWSRSKPEE